MTPETPLADVAVHLPRRVAIVLAEYAEEPVIQQTVLLALRDAMCEWEHQELDLNPIQFDIVVTTVVMQAIDAIVTMAALIAQRNTAIQILGGEVACQS